MTGYLLVAVAAMSWGTWPFFLHGTAMPASLQAAIFMTVATVLSLPVMLRDRVPARARLSHWGGIVWLAVADALNVVLFFAAYQHTSVAIAVLTHYLTPLFVALAAPLVLGERVLPRTVLAVLLAFCGLVLLLQPWSLGLRPTDLVGAALGAGSAVFYASNVLVNKRLTHVFSASELMFYHGVVAVPVMWMLVPSAAVREVTLSSLGQVALGSIGPGFLGGLAFVWGLRRIPASHASVLTLLEPFVAVVLAAIVWQERLGTGQIVGGSLILTGAVLVVAQRAPPPRQSSIMSGS